MLLFVVTSSSLVEQIFKDFQVYGWYGENYCHGIFGGIEITYVDPEGPSGDSGLLSRNENNSGDIITTIEKDGEKFTVTSFSGLVNFLNENTSPGDIIELTVIRDNENLILDVKLGARPLIN